MKIIVKVIYEFTNQDEADMFMDDMVEMGNKVEVVYDEAITKM